MTPDRWNRVKDVLDEALDRPAGKERDAFLDEACAGDDALRVEVESLLAGSDGEVSRFLSEGIPEADRTDSLFERDAALEEGARIGPYRLDGLLGRGGMGTVYRAVRADGQHEREVALKVIRPGLYSDNIAQRFRAERQILASLEHPGIARLYDSGLSGDGRPYFAMERVDGTPLGRYCEEAACSIDQRLRLFEKVADAVAHAHRTLVVHRDLKPSNMLVTADGAPKLLDFGIAKLLDDEAIADAPVTRTGRPLMTPAYAAPEQVRGEAITPATDVYALGVVLYELLTGRRPYRFEKRTPSHIEEVICETRPEPPSTAATRQDAAADTQESSSSALPPPAHLKRRLRGDLDRIIMKALRKEPARRYASAAELADDLRRYRDGLPVEARPSTWQYRASKFLRRNRWRVAAATVLLLLLAGYAATVTVQSRRLATERDRARTNAEKAEQVSAFLTNLFEAGNPNVAQGDTITARELLARGVERTEALADQPAVQAEVQSVIGRVYTQMGRYTKATPLLEEALSTRRTLPTDDPASSEQLASSLHNLGANQQVLNEVERAERLYREALTYWRTLPDARRTTMVETLNNLAGILRAQSDYDAARPVLRETITMARRLDGERKEVLPVALANLAEIRHREGDYPAADSLYREALEMGTEVMGEHHPYVLVARSNQAELYRESGRLNRAEELQRAVLEVRQSRYPEHAVRIALSRTALGHTLRAQDKHDASMPVYRTALTSLREHVPDNHVYVADALNGLGAALIATGMPGQADSLLRESLSIREEKRGPQSWEAAESKSFLGASLAARERYAEAEPLLHDAHATLRRTRSSDDPYTRQTLRHLVQFYADWGRPDRAAAWRDSLAVAK